jgi:hypothetical protein
MTEFYCWVCDYSSNSGEGNLARLFVKKKEINNKIKLFSNNNLEIKNKLLYNIINYKYFSPIIGIIFCWFCFFNKKKVIFLNYLPFWNILIFILLPPKTEFGPITGGSNFSNNKINLVRKYAFPILYKISEFFIYIRVKKIIFSTDLLTKYINKKTILKSEFNYIFKMKKKKKSEKKDIDFFIYYRKHLNKESFFDYNFIKKLISLKYKIHVAGDHLNYPSIINHGYINNKFINKFLSRSRYTLASGENLYSVFTMECLNNNVKIIVKKKDKYKINFFKKEFIILDYEKIYNIINLKSSMNNPIFNNQNIHFCS